MDDCAALRQCQPGQGNGLRLDAPEALRNVNHAARHGGDSD
jgi:hypothetical protein